MLKSPELNIQAILDLADYIEASDCYNQTLCGYCIAGHLLRQQDKSPSYPTTRETFIRALKTSLGVSGSQAGAIWHTCPLALHPIPGRRRHPTNKDAAAMLRHLTVTGVVDWMASEH